jgi:osmotically-inducible protein OsmY
MGIKSDRGIEEEVIQEIGFDGRLEGAHIAVTVEDGVVMLTGTVSGYAKKLAAQEAAHRVGGVLDVVNEIHINGDWDHCDRSIARAVRAALELADMVPDERISATVSEGWITLEGHVERLRQCDEAQRAVCALAGVRGVYNKITIDWPSARPMTCGTAPRRGVGAALSAKSPVLPH